MKQDWKRQKYLASNNEVSNELDLGDKNRGKKEKKYTFGSGYFLSKSRFEYGGMQKFQYFTQYLSILKRLQIVIRLQRWNPKIS